MKISKRLYLYKIKTHFHNRLIYRLFIINNDLNFSICYDFNQYFDYIQLNIKHTMIKKSYQASS